VRISAGSLSGSVGIILASGEVGFSCIGFVTKGDRDWSLALIRFLASRNFV